MATPESDHAHGANGAGNEKEFSSTNSPQIHEIVILGLHHSGIRCAHYLLRHVIPRLAALTPNITYHLTMIAPHTEFFWNPSSPRYLVDTTDQRMPLHKVYLPIAPVFKDYDPKLFSFLTAKATALDEPTRMVTAKRQETGELVIVRYDSLIVATGTYSSSPLWRMNCGQEETKAAYAAYKGALQTAQTVMIAGGGAVGVECAGEVATRYPKAKVKLLSGSYRLLPRVQEASGKMARIAQTKLEKLGIEVIHGVKVLDVSQSISRDGKSPGTTNVRLSNLTEEECDVYLDATGGKPSTDFLPKPWLDERNFVAVDHKTLRVRDTTQVYAIGDCASYSEGTLFSAMRAVAPCCLALAHDVAKAHGVLFAQPPKTASPLKATIFVPVGPTGGVGQLLGRRLPSLAIWLIKARDYQTWLAPLTVTAKDCAKP